MIGIINTWSEMNPCHAHLRERAEAVKRGVWQAGGFPVELPAMSLGEGYVKPEVGAKYVGVIQNPLSICRLHGIDPYDYLVDVLQRVGQHPASQVAELTPRIWKQRFADNPLRSDISRLAQ